MDTEPIIIVVEGGVVTSVLSKKLHNVIVRDWDNINGGDEDPIEISDHELKALGYKELL